MPLFQQQSNVRRGRTYNSFTGAQLPAFTSTKSVLLLTSIFAEQDGKLTINPNATEQEKEYIKRSYEHVLGKAKREITAFLTRVERGEL